MAKGSATRDGSKSRAITEYLAANPSTSAKAVVEALSAQGISVSVGLVNKVKYGSRAATKSKRAGAKKAPRGRRPASAGASMSDAIRAYMEANPQATRPEIRDGLNAQGVKVSTSLVNAVYIKAKARSGQTGTPARRGRRPAAAPAAAAAVSTASISAQELINAKSLVNQLGGIDRVRQALGLLEQLQ